MARLFLTGNDVKLKSHDKIFIDAELFSGEKYTDLEPRRLFPLTGDSDYITFLDSGGEEVFILRRTDELPEDQRDMLERCLWEYYRIPKITRIIKRSDSRHVWTWTVDTDRGEFTFEITNVLQSIKMFYDRRILIKDSKDNRYEIPDLYKLDRRSIKMIQPEM